MGKRMQLMLVCLATVQMSSGCAITTVPGSGDTLSGTAWVLTDLPGQDEVRDRPLTTMQFAGGRIQGSDGCNRYSVSYMATERELLVGSDMATTKMMCPAAVMKQATAFRNVLAAARTFMKEGRRLILVDGRDRDLAVFRVEGDRLADLPSRDLLLCGNREVVIEYRHDTLVLSIGRETFLMRPVRSASGSKYVADNDPKTTFWSKGDRAQLVVKGQSLPECTRASVWRLPHGR